MALTTVGDLLTYVRQELNSQKVGGVDTYALWKDDELINYIDFAQQEFSRLTMCLPDNTNFTINLTATESTYAYDPQIIDIQGGYTTTSKRRVKAISFSDFEKRWILNLDYVDIPGNWEDDTGIPRFLITDLMQGYLRTYPIPTSNDVLTLYVFKVANSVDEITDNLEIEQQYRLGLAYKVMALAYQKHDVLETEDLQRSMLMGQKWQSFWQDAKATYDQRFNRV
jgi:hypothetical protein